MTAVQTPTEPLTKADLVERTRALLPAIALDDRVLWIG